MKIVIVFICVLITSEAFCQTNDTLLRKYDQQFIYRYGRSFMKGGIQSQLAIWRSRT